MCSSLRYAETHSRQVDDDKFVARNSSRRQGITAEVVGYGGQKAAPTPLQQVVWRLNLPVLGLLPDHAAAGAQWWGQRHGRHGHQLLGRRCAGRLQLDRPVARAPTPRRASKQPPGRLHMLSYWRTACSQAGPCLRVHEWHFIAPHPTGCAFVHNKIAWLLCSARQTLGLSHRHSFKPCPPAGESGLFELMPAQCARASAGRPRQRPPTCAPTPHPRARLPRPRAARRLPWAATRARPPRRTAARQLRAPPAGPARRLRRAGARAKR